MKKWPSLGLILAAFVAGRLSAQTATARDPYAGLDTYARVLSTIQTWYVDETSQEELVWRSLEGMEDAMDRHSTFFPPAVWKGILRNDEDNFLGIGVECSWEKDHFRVLRVAKDSPAATAGIEPGALIWRIDAVILGTLGEEEARQRLMGQPGKLSEVEVEWEGQRSTLLLPHLPIPRLDVESSREGAIGRITLGSFRVGSAERFGEKLKALGDIKGLVVDLRGNPGGSLDEAVGIADLFLGEGPVVRVRARATSEELYQSHSGGEFAAPVAVLIDGQSASAAEVLAGALQRRGRASLFGSRSWGKGSVQRYYEYEDGSALKLTFARYYLPDDRSVEGVGLEPDFTVEAAAGDDRVLRSALEWLRKQAPPG